MTKEKKLKKKENTDWQKVVEENEIWKSLHNLKDEAYFRYQLLLELTTMRRVQEIQAKTLQDLANFLKEEEKSTEKQPEEEEEEEDDEEDDDFDSEFDED